MSVRRSMAWLRIELLRRDVVDRALEVPARRVVVREAEVQDLRTQLAVEHDVRRLEVAVLDAQPVRAIDRIGDVADDRGPLPELERAADAAELEPLDELHDDHGRVRVRAELEDLHHARVGEQRERSGLAEEVGELRADARARVRPDELRRDRAAEVQVLQLVDLAHAALAQAFDGLKAVDRGQAGPGRRPARRRPIAIGGLIRSGIQRDCQVQVPMGELAQLGGDLRPSAGERVDRRQLAVPHVVVDHLCEERFEVRVGRHAGRTLPPRGVPAQTRCRRLAPVRPGAAARRDSPQGGGAFRARAA